MDNIFLYSHWIALPLPTRHEIARQFGIVKKSPTHVFDNVVKDDGFLVKDIESALTIEAIQKYLGTNDTDMVLLWNCMVDKIEGRGMEFVENIIPQETPSIESNKKVTKKKNEKRRTKK